MSTRTTLRPYSVITNGGMHDVLTSDVTVLASLSKVSYSLRWADLEVGGSAAVEVSNEFALDGAGNVLNPGSDWTTLTLSVNGAPVQAIDLAGATGNAFIDIETCSAYAIRLVYTPTADISAGTLNVLVSGKVA